MSEPAQSPPHRRGVPRVLRWLLRAVALGALFVACNSGGVAATTLFPSTADTLNYGASLHLSISPADLSALQSPTVFGTIRVSFAGPVPAPGVLAQVQVKERITELLSRPGVTVSSLEPGPLELEHAARDVVVNLGWHFAIGSLCAAVLALVAYAGWRHRRIGAGAAAVVAAVWVASCVATFGVLALTYQPDRLDRFTTTGLLGAVQRTPELLAGVESRAQETTPYLKNLLALSAALQDKYRPQALNTPTAARFLLVSDLHGANQYALMRTIVEQEHIDAVIDSGDLVNFGSVTEAQAAGMFKGITSLGVPYLFVKGNHDARSATDHDLLDRLATLPNVVLLQPDASTYTIKGIHGIRIAGFNDPRWFGDDNQDNAAKQKPAADRFNTAMADRPVPDIVVAHEPAGADDVAKAGIRINGHMHIATLDGTRIGVGTFTGGGPFSHFITEPGGAELTGQPSAFDIATFGDDCRLTALTRYQFRNVIEGRPAYDDVTLVNGSRIEVQVPAATAPSAGASAGGGSVAAAAPARTCSGTLSPTTERVPAPATTP